MKQTTKQPKQIDKQQLYDKYSEQSQEYVSPADELQAYADLTQGYSKQAGWLNEGWDG